MALAVGANRKTVSSAGTAEVIVATAHEVQSVIITAETNNTGIMVVGGSTVVAALSTRSGVPLNAGDSVTLYSVDLNKVYLDTTVSGDGVTYLYSW
tara:strand:+ start:627 stop:914 length:288 start_codon:yes stop_codon:yes gene_type:complete